MSTTTTNRILWPAPAPRPDYPVTVTITTAGLRRPVPEIKMLSDLFIADDGLAPDEREAIRDALAKGDAYPVGGADSPIYTVELSAG